MSFESLFLFFIILYSYPTFIYSQNLLHIDPNEVTLTVGEHKTVSFSASGSLSADVHLELRREDQFDATPHIVLISADKPYAEVIISGIKVISSSVLEIEKCHYVNSTSECPFSNVNRTFATVHVVRSNALSISVIIVGWVYFFAWSISFYPQIYLNFIRRSVVGLNFDFLLLNTIGFTCYTLFNVLMFFDENIQDIYEDLHPHSLIPVLLNDVVFAAHALFACLLTALQCFFYQRGGQRVSYICGGLSSFFVSFALVCLLLTIIKVIDALQFIMFLSYIKMAITLCKYFPQAFFNFRRKSTVGWSIGNVLLDFLGGSMDILQMILQSANTDDWTSFYGNPVKFGLGLVSMIFDVVFMVQHYILYSNTGQRPENNTYEGIQQGQRNENDEHLEVEENAEQGSTAPIMPDSTPNAAV